MPRKKQKEELEEVQMETQDDVVVETAELEEEVDQEELNLLDEIKERYRKAGTIAIRPYVNPEKENMGLENYGYVLFPGTYQMEDMACVMFRGKLRYLNGLDEFAPSVQSIDNKERKSAKVKQIRTIVAELELTQSFNTIDINDDKFWNKVETFRPDNKEMWGRMSLKCTNEPIFLDPVKNVNHLLTILAIENGGYPGIAKSLEDAKAGPRDKKWYLDKQSDTVDTKNSSSKIKNKALSVLETLSEENPRKLLYIAKLCDVNSVQYTHGTLQSVVYDNMDAFITGNSSERNIKKAAQMFLNYAELNSGELRLRAMIKDASFYKYIITKGDGLIYTAKDNVMLGRNVSEVYEFLNVSTNDRVLDKLMLLIEGHWNK